MVAITLKAKHHALIISLLTDKNRVDLLNYLFQVSKAFKAMVDADGEVDMEAEITVNTTPELVKYAYYSIGSYPERLVASDNKAIKEALLPQLANEPELLEAIQAITMNNANETEAQRQMGVDFINSIAV